MDKFVSFLRSINVSGKNKILMTELQTAYQDIGFCDVKTYIQSGNIVFSSESSNKELLIDTIQKKIKDRFGYNIFVFIKNIKDLESIIQNSPYTHHDISKINITLLSSKPSHYNEDDIYNIKADKEEITIINDIIYLFTPDGYGKTRLSNSFLEKKLNTSATTRNWKTITAIYELLQGI